MHPICLKHLKNKIDREEIKYGRNIYLRRYYNSLISGGKSRKKQKGVLSDCSVSIQAREEVSLGTRSRFHTQNFDFRFSRLGGIRDVRPIMAPGDIISSNTSLFNNIGNSPLAKMYTINDRCTMRQREEKSLCFGLTGAMKTINRMFPSLPPIQAFNVNITNKLAFTINNIPPVQQTRQIIAISSRRDSQYGHYTLGILDTGGTLYTFDPQNSKNNMSSKTWELVKKKAPEKTISLYTLNPTCYKTFSHQTPSSHFCSIWVSCLAFLLNANPTRTIKEIFDYFGYKAKNLKYLDQKIHLFAVYIYEWATVNNVF